MAPFRSDLSSFRNCPLNCAILRLLVLRYLYLAASDCFDCPLDCHEVKRKRLVTCLLFISLYFLFIPFLDYKKLGAGIASIWIREVGSVLDNQNFQVLSDVVVVSVLPAVSVEVDFEEAPRVEVELATRRAVGETERVSCGRIESSTE